MPGCARFPALLETGGGCGTRAFGPQTVLALYPPVSPLLGTCRGAPKASGCGELFSKRESFWARRFYSLPFKGVEAGFGRAPLCAAETGWLCKANPPARVGMGFGCTRKAVKTSLPGKRRPCTPETHPSPSLSLEGRGGNCPVFAVDRKNEAKTKIGRAPKPRRFSGAPIWSGEQRRQAGGSRRGLFEGRRPEFRSRPAWRVAQRSWRSQPRKWGRLFFGYFLLAKQKKVARPQAESSLKTRTLPIKQPLRSIGTP